MLLSLLALQGRSPSVPTFLRVLTHCQRSYHVNNTVVSHQISSTAQHRQPTLATRHQAATWMLPLQLRHLTTAGQQQPLTLKTALRQLYKRVHPDLFVDFPAEQAENERSFKLLQDYLHQARTPNTGAGSRSAFHFKFFLIPHTHPAAYPDSDDDSTSTSATDGPQFDLVQLVLVPPTPPRALHPPSSSSSSSSNSSQSLSPGAKQGLLKLLGMCGFADVDAEEEGGEAGAQEATARLTTFLPEAAEVVRQHESGPTKHETRVANLRAAFRLAHGVIAGFLPGMFTGAQQVQHLQRLADAFDLLSDDPPELAGLHIMICGRTALDSQGTLCLDAAADIDDWAAFLGGVDPDYAHEKKASAAAVRGLEGQVAAAVGVRMFFTAAPYLMTHEYRYFLEKMAAYAAAQGPVQLAHSSSDSSSSGSSASSLGARPSASVIPVYVAPTYQVPEQQQQQAVVHETVGYIQVPMQASAQQVYQLIQKHAHTALAVLSKKAAEQAEQQELSANIRNRLHLRRLLKDDIISMQDFRNACRRLVINKDALLASHIEGLSVRVSDKNRVAPDGSLVDIAWDFDM